jgi:hypothetical protein
MASYVPAPMTAIIHARMVGTVGQRGPTEVG